MADQYSVEKRGETWGPINTTRSILDDLIHLKTGDDFWAPVSVYKRFGSPGPGPLMGLGLVLTKVTWDGPL